MSNKTILVGVIVSSHIDIPISVPENLDIKNLTKWELKEKLSNGDFKCRIKELQEGIEELFSGSNGEIDFQDLCDNSYELNVCNTKFKKIDFILDEKNSLKPF